MTGSAASQNGDARTCTSAACTVGRRNHVVDTAYKMLRRSRKGLSWTRKEAYDSRQTTARNPPRSRHRVGRGGPEARGLVEKGNHKCTKEVTAAGIEIKFDPRGVELTKYPNRGS